MDSITKYLNKYLDSLYVRDSDITSIEGKILDRDDQKSELLVDFGCDIYLI